MSALRPDSALLALGAWTTNPSDLLAGEGRLLQGVALAALLWPTFLEVDGHIIREACFSPDTFQAWRQQTGNNRQAVESVLNHIHIYDLFPAREAGADDPLDAYEFIGQVLLRTWRAALQDQYPERSFELHFATEPDDYGPTIYVWQTPTGDS